jgi:molybdenum cofactor cytidylyltransferase
MALPTVLVLASGRGTRFAASGGDVYKLQAILAGKPVLEHTLDAVRASGLPWHVEGPGDGSASHAGMGDSIAAAVRATPGAAGWLILPGDLPLVRPETLQILANAAPIRALVPLYQGQRGHPVRFSPDCGPELMNLRGEMGAAQVLSACIAMNSVAFIDVADAGVVTDIDMLADLERAEQVLAGR